jgi:hypothetical protein
LAKIAENCDHNIDPCYVFIQGVHLKIAANVSSLYCQHTNLLPEPNHCFLLARYVVKLLAGFPTPEPVTPEFLKQVHI